MARPKKEPDYDPQRLKKALLDDIREAYENPLPQDADRSGHMKIIRLAEEFSATPLKIRKLLVTAGAYSTLLCQRVQELQRSGKTLEEIQEMTGLSRASINGYLPYTKSIYNMKRLSLQAKRLQVYRARKSAVHNLLASLSQGKKRREAELWNAVLAFENYPFHTASGERFRYTVDQSELYLEKNRGTITRDTLNAALTWVLECGQDQRSVGEEDRDRWENSDFLFAVFLRFCLLAP